MRMKHLLILFICLYCGHKLSAQERFRILVRDASNGEPLPGVSIVSRSNPTIGTISDPAGVATLEGLPNGTDTLLFTYTGYKEGSLIAIIPDTSVHIVSLTVDQHALNEVVVVASTRSNDRIENATTKVEVLGLEEMREESMVKPASVASILGDISGVQIQQSSAASGNVNVRIQGLDGRYTQMLRDGMPLYEGFSGGFGVLSIPPLDLQQLELIKGSASTLYGGGAIGGLINFISKRPGNDPDASFVLNGSTLREGNLNGYFGQRWKGVGLTFFAGQTIQGEVDVDDDGLSDVPRLNSTLVHPTLFFYPSDHSSIAIGWSGSFEQRTGGDMKAIEDHGDAAHPYFEKNDLKRHTFSLISQNRFRNGLTGYLKGTFSQFDRSITTNTYYFRGAQQNYYVEASALMRLGKHTLIGGANGTGDYFKPSDATPAMVGEITNNVGGLFFQDTWQILAGTKIEGGLRYDYHERYGSFLLPRLAIFHRIDQHWGLRGGFGSGYKVPNPLSPQTRDYDIHEIHAIQPGAIAERSYGGNLEGNYGSIAQLV
jgi:outer membrane receptor for ferrienterochelin and colicins